MPGIRIPVKVVKWILKHEMTSTTGIRMPGIRIPVKVVKWTLKHEMTHTLTHTHTHTHTKQTLIRRHVGQESKPNMGISASRN